MPTGPSPWATATSARTSRRPSKPGNPDPAGLTLAEVRPIRDLIETQVRELVEHKLDAIRSDPTVHRLRLQQILPSLADEFESIRAPEEIRACADAILTRFDDQPVRSFAQVLAQRRTRECLRRDVFDPAASF